MKKDIFSFDPYEENDAVRRRLSREVDCSENSEVQDIFDEEMDSYACSIGEYRTGFGGCFGTDDFSSDDYIQDHYFDD